MLRPKIAARPAKVIAPLAKTTPPKTNGKSTVPAPAQPTIPAPVAVTVRIAVDVPEGTPAFYSNYLEVSQTKWDFSLIIARIPVKHSAAKINDMQATGLLPLRADATINFPPTLMAGLIRALTVQKEAYEKATGTILKEDTDDEPSSQGKKRKPRRP